MVEPRGRLAAESETPEVSSYLVTGMPNQNYFLNFVLNFRLT